MQDDQKLDIVEGEITEGPSSDMIQEKVEDAAQGNTATVSLNLESLIKGHLGTLSRLKAEIAEHNDTINNILDNDPTYKQHAEEAKKATKVKTGTKAEIMKRPEVMQVVNKMKASREEYKEQSQTLSELLAEYQRSTGLDSIETEDGKVRKIITTARLG